MKITVRPTPNPNALKFEVKGATLTDERQLAYQSSREASGDELASALFGIRGVETLLITPRWLSVSKHAAADWDLLTESVETLLHEIVGGASDEA